MSSLKYKSYHVACCCNNCLNALGKINGDIKCRCDSKFRHALYECEKYEFSWQRFEDNLPDIKDEPSE